MGLIAIVKLGVAIKGSLVAGAEAWCRIFMQIVMAKMGKTCCSLYLHLALCSSLTSREWVVTWLSRWRCRRLTKSQVKRVEYFFEFSFYIKVKPVKSEILCQYQEQGPNLEISFICSDGVQKCSRQYLSWSQFLYQKGRVFNTEVKFIFLFRLKT